MKTLKPESANGTAVIPVEATPETASPTIEKGMSFDESHCKAGCVKVAPGMRIIVLPQYVPQSRLHSYYESHDDRKYPRDEDFSNHGEIEGYIVEVAKHGVFARIDLHEVVPLPWIGFWLDHTSPDDTCTPQFDVTPPASGLPPLD